MAQMGYATTVASLLLLMVTVSMAADQHINRGGVFARLNYGVIFRPQQPLQLVTDEWTHVFITQLPDQYDARDDTRYYAEFNCSKVYDLSEASCKAFQPLFNTLVTLHKTSASRVRAVIDHIYSILPDSYHNRRSRGLFDLGGRILNSLFGVATTDQLDAIRATARHTMADNANAFHQWQKHAEMMSSFMSVTNRRLDNLASVIRDQQTMMKNVYSTVSQLDQDITILRALVTSAIDNITNYITVLNELDDIRIALEDLTHGQLSPILLPPYAIQVALTVLHNVLHKSHTPYSESLLGQVTADYYRMHSFVAARQGSRLLIALNFPIFSGPKDLTLYELQSFPVPVPGDHNVAHVTEITNLPYGIAFASPTTPHEYLIFPHKPELKDNHFLFGHQQSEPLRLFSTHHTCVSALLENDRQHINQLCQFHLRPERLTPSITPLTASTILVTNISSLTYTCDRKRKIASGCIQCQMTLPCHCSLNTPFGFIPPRLSGCTPNHENITLYHTANLAVLQSFFDEERLGSLLGDTLLQHPLSVDLPAFRIFKTNATSQLAKDSLLSYDLNRAINITKAQGKVFHSLAETLWRDAIATESDSYTTTTFTSWTDWTSITYFLSLLLAIFALTGVLFLFYRIKLLATAVATMTVTVHKTAAIQPTLPSFISFFSPSAPTNASLIVPSGRYVTITHAPPMSSYLFLICVILLVILLFKKFRQCTANPNSCMLILEFGNRSNTLLIDCQSLPGSPNQYTFLASKFIDHVEVIGRFKPVMHVSWDTLQIHNTHLNMIFEFNTTIPICLFQAHHLRKIIQDKFWCILTARYEHCLYRIDLIKHEEVIGTSNDTPVDTEIVLSETSQSVNIIVHPQSSSSPRHET